MLENNLFNILTKTAIFSELDESVIMKILASVRYQIKTYNKDVIISSKGDSCDWLQIVVEGSVRGEMVDADGKTLKIENIGQGQAIAIAFLFGRSAKMPVNVISNTKTIIFRLSKTELLKIMQSHTQVLENMLILVSEKAQFLSSRIHFLSLKTIKEKIATYILSMLKANSTSVNLVKNQSQLAEFFGVTRPSLARSLKHLEEENIIEVIGKNIEIKNLNELRKLTM